MTEKKGQKLKVPDLKAKVRTLEVVFGEKFMRSELNPRTVDKWLREPDPTPYLTSLKKSLRQKLEEDEEPRLLHTVRGVGYVLRETV